jgi:hypothetical protein
VRRKRLLGRRRSKRRRARLRRTNNDDEKIRKFEEWCRDTGLALHPQLRIGRTGSRGDIGVVAREDIPQGTLLAVVPRHTILNGASSRVGATMLSDRAFRRQMKTMNSWVPLLLALLAECGHKWSSFWCPYLSLVPNKASPSPVLRWSPSERRRLLGGTGVEERVQRDQANISRDYHTIVLPFTQRHPELFKKSCHSQQFYEQLVSFVMAYSFTDTEERDVCARTMMVPFVDLLNHHSHHHTELSFFPDRLELVTVRDVEKGAEVMNTYGPLSNVSLLHVYGFTEEGNPHDAALIQSSTIRDVYWKSSLIGSCTSHDQRWERVVKEDVMEDEFEVDSSGRPEHSLLAVIKLLHVSERGYSHMRDSVMMEEDLTLENLSQPEREFMYMLCAESLAKFPESYDDLQATTRTCGHPMTDQEYFALQLTLGQQACLHELKKQL